jgi:mono/diheme cytochrome c family protein
MPVTRRGRMMRAIIYRTAWLLVGGLVVLAEAGQKTTAGTQPLVVESMYGPDLFRHYCATCHGKDGRGNGPATAALNVPPPDLTRLARESDGVFPARNVEAIIRGGTAVRAHGSADMPVWGPIFHALDPSDARVNARINALVTHLASIQQK